MRLVTIIAQEDGILLFSAKYQDRTIEGISHYNISNDVLYLNKLHLEGGYAGSVGRKFLWKMAKDLGRQLSVQEVVIQGGRRTTGKYKGIIPSLVTIKVD